MAYGENLENQKRGAAKVTQRNGGEKQKMNQGIGGRRQRMGEAAAHQKWRQHGSDMALFRSALAHRSGARRNNSGSGKIISGKQTKIVANNGVIMAAGGISAAK